MTLFATADSETAGRLASVVPRGYSEDPDADPKVSECLHIAHVFERAGEFDLIHNSFDFLPLTYSGLVPTPMLTTIHGGFVAAPSSLSTRSTTPDPATSRSATPTAIRASTTSRRSITGSTPTLSLFSASAGEYLLFFGRIHPDKGTAEAIDVAARAGLPLVIAGIVQDQAYFDASISPSR